MKNPLARFPDAGSFVAGLLIGISILIPVFAMMVAEPGDWETLWVLCAPTVLALGFLLQTVVRHCQSAASAHRQFRCFWPGYQIPGLRYEP